MGNTITKMALYLKESLSMTDKKARAKSSEEMAVFTLEILKIH